jgi:imidazole glycerol-phosphate synthase subunit HisH
MTARVAIIDYGLGNPLSIQNMLKKVGAGKTVLTRDIEILYNAERLILPGVGHFTQGMVNLKQHGLIEVLNELVLIQKKPILGICLGMQLMTSWGEEGSCDGLNWVEATTDKFRFKDPEMKVPHMGWNDTHFVRPPFVKTIFEEMPPRFYYVHSYFVNCKKQENIMCIANYGGEFCSGFVKDNIMGVQFHPEKSHVFGQAFFKEFLEWKG